MVAFWDHSAHLHCTIFRNCLPLQMYNMHMSKQTTSKVCLAFMNMVKQNDLISVSFFSSSRPGMHEIEHLGGGTSYVAMLSGELSLFFSFLYLSNVVFQLHDTLSIVNGHSELLKYLSGWQKAIHKHDFAY